MSDRDMFDDPDRVAAALHGFMVLRDIEEQVRPASEGTSSGPEMEEMLHVAREEGWDKLPLPERQQRVRDYLAAKHNKE